MGKLGGGGGGRYTEGGNAKDKGAGGGGGGGGGGEAWMKVVINTKLPLGVTNHHDMWTYGGVEVGATYS